MDAAAVAPWLSAMQKHAGLLSGVGVARGSETESRLAQFLALLAEQNKSHALVSYHSEEELVVSHLIDSLKILEALPENVPAGAQALDIGSGGGFPGLPLALARPYWTVALLDSVEKKTRVLKEMADQLSADNIATLWGRAEAWGRDENHREAYDLVFCRAVGRFTEILELSAPFLRLGGTALLHRGHTAPEEVMAAEAALEELACESAGVFSYALPGLDRPRHIVAIEKTGPTPEAYPRRVGVAAKRPL